MNKILIVLLIAVSFSLSSLIHSQDEPALAFGDSTRGEITNRHYEIEYEFQAQVGDVVVITMTPDDDDEFRYPGILMLDAEYDVVAEAFDTYSVTLFHDVKDSATYFVLATRNDGRAGEGEGALYAKAGQGERTQEWAGRL